MEAIRAAQLSSIMLGIFNPSNTDITIITSTQTIPAHSAVGMPKFNKYISWNVIQNS